MARKAAGVAILQVGDRAAARPAKGLIVLAAALLATLWLAAEGRAASWSLRAPGGPGGGGPSIAAEAYSRSGEARLAVGCTENGLLFSSLDYVGYETVAERLRVAYRVDGRNVIAAPWPVEPREGTLLLYQSNDVYLQEFARRLMRGNWLRLEVELLPPLTFALDGSRDAIAAVLDRCGRPGDADGGEGHGEPPPDNGDGRGDGGGNGEGRPGPGDPTPLTR
ncbi:MAG: hypothetical protein GVY13_04785 [Alphaproteobacteria bacterium]|jgi:hypothetical protein|nr:hypothetical protein [Alphaproteobacteria bacterium]